MVSGTWHSLRVKNTNWKREGPKKNMGYLGIYQHWSVRFLEALGALTLFHCLRILRNFLRIIFPSACILSYLSKIPSARRILWVVSTIFWQGMYCMSFMSDLKFTIWSWVHHKVKNTFRLAFTHKQLFTVSIVLTYCEIWNALVCCLWLNLSWALIWSFLILSSIC